MRQNERNTVTKEPASMTEHPVVKGREVFLAPSEGLHVVSWCPTPDGTGKPQQVHLLVPIGHDATIAIRFKSRAAVQSIIDALADHGDDVWEP